ncbi:hypothetical protein HU200_016594 [Digitaria exilis]|uniref:Alpha/beta hydrolase fold-3 domain-containing protein n=1 Tax=Digitaria exilis TaxID=1010633 RepID=A0A835F7D4_9POAL|nr:hypothetical protein HU200_016594 [Digitaria exilis]CAB3491328.1 unnamed protein product [Digitaria exilis]
MADTASHTAAPPWQRKPKPLSRLTRLTTTVAGFVTDAACRADGTLNRAMLSFLDPPVPAFPSSPWWRRRHRPRPRPPRAPLPPVLGELPAAAAPRDRLLPRRRVRLLLRGIASLRRGLPPHRPDRLRRRALRRLPPLAGAPLSGVFPALDVSRCFLAGDSAGGNVAHHVARRYATHVSTFRNVRLAGVIAIQPFFGGEERTPSELRLDGVGPIVSVDRADWMWRAFLPPEADRDHEAANFAHPAAIAGVESPAFPPVLLAIGGFDPLQDWQRRYGEMLRRRGKKVEVVQYPDAIHGF